MSHDRATTDNSLIRRLAAGETALCMAIRISRLPRIVHLARAAGFDAIYVDMEHSTIALETTAELCLASWSIGLPALVRVPTHDPNLISRVLEGGAAGIIAPHVDTAAQALAVVSAARFRPLGHRAMAGAGVAIGYAPIPPAEAEELLGNRTMVVAMVESAEAIANADAIAAVRGVDMLLVGTGDLTEELGIPGKTDHPKVLEAYERAAAACRRNGKWLGIAGIKGESPMLPQLYRLGARFLSTRNDEALLLKAARDETRTLRQLFAG
ncbi:MAG TPA: aldolase/citrate lyase family protein [Stellaceae bacterium]|nr:aldolase/citrate lyase family protein [Stellaceae bacterium]